MFRHSKGDDNNDRGFWDSCRKVLGAYEIRLDGEIVYLGANSGEAEKTWGFVRKWR